MHRPLKRPATTAGAACARYISVDGPAPDGILIKASVFESPSIPKGSFIVKNEVGVLASLQADKPSLAEVARFGLKVCQLCNWNEKLWTDKLADSVRAEVQATGVRITSVWAGYPGPCVWDLVDGPRTIGLVPPEHQAMRVAVLKKAAISPSACKSAPSSRIWVSFPNGRSIRSSTASSRPSARSPSTIRSWA